jgi:hypothetical protein
LSSEKVEPVLEQIGLNRLYPRNRSFSGQGQQSACAIHPSACRSLFGTEWVDPRIFQNCTSRTEGKEKQKEHK